MTAWSFSLGSIVVRAQEAPAATSANKATASLTQPNSPNQAKQAAQAKQTGPAKHDHDHDHDHDHKHDEKSSDAMGIDYTPETEKFKVALDAFRAQLKLLRAAQVRYHNSDTRELEIQYRRQWYAELQPMYQLHVDLLNAALEEFQASPATKVSLGHILFNSLKRNCDKDNFEGMLPIAKALFEMNYPSPELPEMYMNCCLAANDYEQAKALVQNSSLSGEKTAGFAKELDRLSVEWQQELESRRRDEAGEPLPRVIVRTTKGEAVIELFENDAPEAVASFISLAEEGFYDSRHFFFVKDHTIAQTGCSKEDGTGTPPYFLPDENKKDGARSLFRGSLALSILPNRANSGGTVFFIPYLPSLTIEKNYTVFGRVVSGMPAIANLNRVKPSSKEDSEEEKKKKPKLDPDEIISVEIVRKRNHPYVPNKLPIPRG